MNRTLDYSDMEYMTSTPSTNSKAELLKANKVLNDAKSALDIANDNLEKKQKINGPKIVNMQAILLKMIDDISRVQSILADAKSKDEGEQSKEYKDARKNLDDLLKSKHLEDILINQEELKLKPENDAVKRARDNFTRARNDAIIAQYKVDKLQ